MRKSPARLKKTENIPARIVLAGIFSVIFQIDPYFRNFFHFSFPKVGYQRFDTLKSKTG